MIFCVPKPLYRQLTDIVANLEHPHTPKIVCTNIIADVIINDDDTRSWHIKYMMKFGDFFSCDNEWQLLITPCDRKSPSLKIEMTSA